MADHNPPGPRSKPQSGGRHPKRSGAGNGIGAIDYFAVVWEDLIYDRRVSDGALRLWCILRRHADDQGLSYPKRSTLAKMCGCSVDTIDRRIRELEATDWLLVMARYEGGEQIPNHYMVRGPSRVDAAAPGLTDAATPGRVDAAQNQSLLEPEPLELDVGPTARDAATAAFEAWWLSYPKRDGRTRGDKKRARGVWDRLSAGDHALAVIGVVHYTAGTDPQFVKDADGWLRGRRFEEWQEPGKQRGKPREGWAGPRAQGKQSTQQEREAW